MVELPTPYDYGSQFNYDVWTPNTVITLCNVPWASDYRDVVYYDTIDDLIEYLQKGSGPTITYNNSTLIVAGRPILIDIPVNQAYRYNYLHVHNPQMPGSWPNNMEDYPRDFFYFILDVQYLAPNTTRLMVQLDVWQSFGRSVKFGQCYIERGHIGVANTRRMEWNGRNFLAIPEGLDLGNEYVIKDTKFHEIAIANTVHPTYEVMVWSTISLEDPTGTVKDPTFTMADGSQLEGLPNGVSIYMFEQNDWREFLYAYRDYPWVTQGIISVMVVPGDMIEEYHNGATAVTLEHLPGKTVNKLINSTGGYSRRITPYKGEWTTNYIGSFLPEEFSFLDKFKVYPYSMFEVTTNNGTPLVIKPECIPDVELTFLEYVHFAPPAPRIMFQVYKYNMQFGKDDAMNFEEYSSRATKFSGGEDFDMMTGITNLPTFSVLNNSYMNYLASNANAISYAHQSAEWSQDRAIAGAQASFNIASNAVSAGRQQTNNSNLAALNQTINSNTAISRTASLNEQQAIYNSLINVAGGAINGGMSGGLPGMATGIVGQVPGVAHSAVNVMGIRGQSGIQQQSNTNANEISMAAASRSFDISADQQRYARDTNYEYARYAANGDYENAIAGINAKVQDAKMMQPTTVGQVGGEAFNLATTGWYLLSKLKMVDEATMRIIGTFWLRYGYAINRWASIPAKYACMSKFTYWKIRESYLVSSSCPEVYKQTIRGVFEKGVTVWRDAADIGMIALSENKPLEGITL